MDKAQCYIELAKTRWGQFNVRRNFQWKVNFSLWTVLAILIGFGIRGEIPTISCVVKFVFVGVHVFISVLYIYWLAGLHFANRTDKKMAIIYQNNAERNLGIEDKNLTDKKVPLMPPFFRLWSLMVEFMITLSLVILDIIVYLNIKEVNQGS